MRISDWSSDVCSSDLNVDILEAGEATIERDRIGAGRAGAVENQRIIAVATEQIVGSVDHTAAVDDIVAVAQRDRRGAARRVDEVANIDRKRVVSGKSGAVRGDSGGCGVIHKKK